MRTENQQIHSEEETKPKRKELITILISRKVRREIAFPGISKGETHHKVSTLEANGSVQSIVDWAQKSEIDKHQT